MPTTYKRLGSSAPNATTYTELYQAPEATAAIVSSLVITNRGSTVATYRIHQSASGSVITSPANSDFIAFDVSIPPNDAVALTLGMTINQREKIGIYSSTSNLTFTAFGSEVT